jgi:TonB family protein
MKTSLQDGLCWTRGRFLAVAGVLFALQAGLILLFGDRSLPSSPPPAPSTRFHALGRSVGEQDLLRLFFVSDPAAFPLPNAQGFSGRAWLNQLPPAYQSEVQLEPPSWLSLDTARLGTNFPAPPLHLAALSPDLARQQTFRLEPLPVFLAPEIVPTQSLFRLEGELEGCLRGRPLQLRSWSSSQLLSNSVVQIAVDPAGAVLAARLDTRSGSAEADAEAVALARALRFTPGLAGRTRWGRAVFQWQTTEPAAAGQPEKAP